MGFASGSISFRRFAVVGKVPRTADQSLLDALAEHVLRPSEFGKPEEIEYGWSGGRHVLDGQFTVENNIFNDALHFGLRIDTNRFPSNLKKAYQIIEEAAAAASNPSGFISKNQKRDVKESLCAKIDDELRSGKFRRSKLLPILWDIPGQMLYSAASGTAFEKLAEIFERTFNLSLEPITSGSLALRLLEARGRRRDHEDAKPTQFIIGPEGDSHHPDYPWGAKGDGVKDFMGNEFMLWLWHETDARHGTIRTESASEVTVYIDRTLDLECAYGITGKESLKGDGPSRMPEARDGLRNGKVPRRMGLVLDVGRQQYTLNLSAESLAVGGAKLPDVEEAESPRVLFEERVTMLRDLCKGMDALYDTFLKVRAGSAWDGHVSAIRKWIMKPERAVAAA